MYGQRVGKLERCDATGELFRAEPETHVRALRKRDIQKLPLGRTGGWPGDADFAVRQVLGFDLALQLPVPAIPPSVARQDDLVAPNDLLVSKTQPPRLTRRIY